MASFLLVLSMDFTRKWGYYLDGVWLWRISGSYSQEVSMLLIGVP